VPPQQPSLPSALAELQERLKQSFRATHRSSSLRSLGMPADLIQGSVRKLSSDLLQSSMLNEDCLPAAAPQPHLQPPASVPMSLSEYLLRDIRAKQTCEHPVGYKGESDGDKLVLTHRGSGVKLWALPIPLAGALDTDLLLYHYMDRESFHAICESSEVLVTLLERAPKQENPPFGEGLYMTTNPPEHFGTKSAVLLNLYSNASDRSTQLQHIEPHCSMADYCIPFLVPLCHVKDVMHEATPEMSFGAGFTVTGEYIRGDRDVRMVRIDPVDDAVRRLGDPVAALRTRAVRSVREIARRGDERVVEALLQRTGAERDRGVRAAAAGALGEVAQRGDVRACEALLRCLGTAGDVQLREAAALALGKVAPRSNGQVIEALACCLDSDPDRGARASAAFVLGKVACMDDLRAVEALTYRFEDQDEDDRVSAVAGHALKRLGLDVDVDDEAVDENQCVLS